MSTSDGAFSVFTGLNRPIPVSDIDQVESSFAGKQILEVLQGARSLFSGPSRSWSGVD